MTKLIHEINIFSVLTKKKASSLKSLNCSPVTSTCRTVKTKLMMELRKEKRLKRIHFLCQSTHGLNGALEHLLLEPEVLHVLAPPFIGRSDSEVMRSHGKRRRSFLRKKREQPPSAAAIPIQGLVIKVIIVDSSSLESDCFSPSLLFFCRWRSIRR